MKERQCKHCKEMFKLSTAYSAQKYCSKECYKPYREYIIKPTCFERVKNEKVYNSPFSEGIK